MLTDVINKPQRREGRQPVSIAEDEKLYFLECSEHLHSPHDSFPAPSSNTRVSNKCCPGCRILSSTICYTVFPRFQNLLKCFLYPSFMEFLMLVFILGIFSVLDTVTKLYECRPIIFNTPFQFGVSPFKVY